MYHSLQNHAIILMENNRWITGMTKKTMPITANKETRINTMIAEIEQGKDVQQKDLRQKKQLITGS